MTAVSLGYSLLGLVLFFFAAIWFGCSRYSKDESGYCLFAFGYSSLWGMGVILVSLRGDIWDWLSYSLSSFVIIAGFVCLVRSVELLYKLPASRLVMTLLLLVSGLLLIIIGPVKEYQPYRLMVLGIVSAYCCVLALKKGVRPIYRQHGWTVAGYMAGVGIVAMLLWMLRLPLGLQSPEALDIVSESLFNLSALYLSWLIAICFQGAALFLMITRYARQLEQLSIIDYLTGAHNRLGLKKSWMRMLPRQQSGSLLILDIDHFKKVNDSFGHDFGDAVLKLVVRRINGCMRSDDVLSRYGGEEFVVLLPGSNLDKGYAMAERIRTAIEKDPLELSGRQVNVTVSIGVVSFGYQNTDIDAFISKADKALYQAKEQGRNRVVIAQG
ncbi:MAG: GGDEF domain-containing protein [Amphritea sp.]